MRDVGVAERQVGAGLGELGGAGRLVVAVPGADEDVGAAERVGRCAEAEAQDLGERAGEVPLARAVVRVVDGDRRRRAGRHERPDVGLLHRGALAHEADAGGVNGERDDEEGEEREPRRHGTRLWQMTGGAAPRGHPAPSAAGGVQAGAMPRSSAASRTAGSSACRRRTLPRRSRGAARSKRVTFVHNDSNVDHQRRPAAPPR